MRAEIRSHKDLAAGSLFLVVGIVWAIASLRFRVGTATAMGPGFFPLAVSLLLAGLGVCAIVRSVKVSETDAIGPWPYAALLIVMTGVIAFGLLLENAGLLAAAIALVSVSCLQRWRRRPIETAVLTAVLVALVAGIFVFGLGMTVDLY